MKLIKLVFIIGALVCLVLLYSFAGTSVISQTKSGTPNLDAFRKWAKETSVDKELILIYVADQFDVLGYNCFLPLKKTGVKNVGVLTTSQKTTTKLKSLGVPCFEVSTVSPDLPLDVQLGNKLVPKSWEISRTRLDWASRWTEGRTKFIWKHWMLRDFLILELVRSGLSVFCTDADVIFFENIHTGIAVVGQTQDWPHPASLNHGIGRISPDHGGLMHEETVVANMR